MNGLLYVLKFSNTWNFEIFPFATGSKFDCKTEGNNGSLSEIYFNVFWNYQQRPSGCFKRTIMMTSVLKICAIVFKHIFVKQTIWPSLPHFWQEKQENCSEFGYDSQNNVYILCPPDCAGVETLQEYQMEIGSVTFYLDCKVEDHHGKCMPNRVEVRVNVPHSKHLRQQQ